MVFGETRAGVRCPSGAADVGIVAISLALAPTEAQGRYVEVPLTVPLLRGRGLLQSAACRIGTGVPRFSSGMRPRDPQKYGFFAGT